MRRKTLWLYIVAGLAIATIALTTIHLRFIMTGSDSDLIWNDENAYLFVHSVDFGYKVPLWEYPVDILLQLLNGTRSSDERHFHLTVFQITVDKVERYEFDNLELHEFSGSDRGVFANDNGKLVKWTGKQFLPASQQDVQAGKTNHGRSADDHNGSEGWHSQQSLFSRPSSSTIPMQLGGKSIALFCAVGEEIKAVDLVDTERHPTRLIAIDESSRRVSRAEYDRIFSGK
jgi:hypothetical protein